MSKSLDRFAEPLKHIPAVCRDTWVSVGMALHHESGGSDAGFALWCDWSRGVPEKYDERSQRQAWRSFKCGRGKTGGTIIALARENGWSRAVARPIMFGQIAEQHQREAKQAEDSQRQAQTLKRILAGTVAIEGTPADAYLQSRAIRPPFPRSLRFHRGLVTRNTDGQWITSPALVAAVARSGTGKVTGLLRTFITNDGRKRSDVDAPKKMLGAIRGAAVWPDEVGTVLAIAEGIETAISVQKLSTYPTAAALAAGFLREVVVPDRIVELVIAADNDPNGIGLKAARAAMFALWRPWRTVRIVFPRDLKDFNDVLKGGSDGRSEALYG
jgi:putative DNA primase/helicase